MNKISEKEREPILKESLDFLKEASKKLEKITEFTDEGLYRVDAREESLGSDPDPEFNKVMFENAHEVKEDLIVGERGAWKK